MFGLFKKHPNFNSPEDKLKHEMHTKIANRAILIYRESPLKGTMLEGRALVDGINQAKEFYSNRSISISEDYRVSRENTIKIIDECARSVYNELIES
ncbi:MAG: hypothetical protein APF83_01185 [Lutibacter sp. BRH_c52]|nr:MAG: hypothetical protein APF83_01185 [Lutibacter sp. BRH_c52]HCE53842.1 hypothetical protein [Lutibacter sp.]